MKKTLAVCLTFIMVIGLFSGCGRTVEADSDRELNITINTTPATMVGQMCSDDVSSTCSKLYLGGLYEYDENNNAVPSLAESSEISEDGLTITYHLRDGLVWSDGRKLTASDFVFAFKYLANPLTGSNALYLITDCCAIKNVNKILSKELPLDQLGVSAPDDRTFVVELEKPCPYINSLFCKPNFSPINEEFYNSCHGEYGSSADTLLSCGPFTVDRYEPMAMQIHYTKNENYVFSSKIHVPGVTLQVIANTQQSVMSYKNGDFDAVVVSGDVLEKESDNPDLVEFTAASMKYLYVNCRANDTMNNKNIRIAISKSIDRESIVNDYYHAGYSVLQRISARGYYQDTNGEDFFGDDHRYDETIAYDPEKAREYWEKGLAEIGNRNPEITIAFTQAGQGLAEIIQQDCEKNLPGLKFKMITLQNKDWLVAPHNDKYDLIITGWVGDYADPTTFMNLCVTDSLGEYSYSNPEYDKLIGRSDDADIAFDPVKRNELLHKAEDIAMGDAAIIPLAQSLPSSLVRGSVKGYKLDPMGCSINLLGVRKEGNE